MKINEMAKRTGVSVRTLHYYDEIGLLTPSETSHKGYRLYHHAALEQLQQILFFKELDFPLQEIKEMMQSPTYERKTALNHHKQLLLAKRDRLEGLITLVEDTLKGENEMNFTAFDTTEIEAQKQQYVAEAKQRWGHTDAYAESQQKAAQYTDETWKTLQGEGAQIMQAFAALGQEAPDSAPVQALVKTWQAYITKNFYQCTKEILACLGQMYVGDERFTQNINQYGEGTAQQMAQAIEIYCAS